MSAIHITHYSDILCVWAYVSQVRINELESEFANQVEMDFRLLSVFGHAQEKLQDLWRDRGGIEAYSQHVQQVVERFGHVEVHPEIWLVNAPLSSLPSHLFLSAVKIAEAQQLIAEGSYNRYAWHLREAFFAHAMNIANQQVLISLAEELEIPISKLEEKVASGEAYAAMSVDMQLTKERDIKSSPTLVFNEDRQRLTGNVGYRIIRANIRELLDNPADQQSWC